MITKTQKAINLVKACDYKKALSIVSKFKRLTKEEKKIFGDGQSATTNPRFYTQLHSSEWVESAITTAHYELMAWAKTNTKKVPN